MYEIIKFRECAFNLKNVGAMQAGKETIVTSASDLLTVPMVFVMSPLNVYVTKVSYYVYSLWFEKLRDVISKTGQIRA